VGSVTASGYKCVYTAPSSIPNPNPVIVKLRATLGAHVVYAVARAKITDKEEWFGSYDITENSTGYNYHVILDFVQTDSDPSVLDRHFNVDPTTSSLSATPPKDLGCTIAPLWSHMNADDGSLEVDYTGSSTNPKATTTGGKTFWPVTVTCEGQSYPASLGGLWLAPDQAFANKDSNIFRIIFTINTGTLTGTAELRRYD